MLFLLPVLFVTDKDEIYEENQFEMTDSLLTTTTFGLLIVQSDKGL